MKTKLIDGVLPLANDEEVLAIITDETDPHGGRGVYTVGIRNAQGSVYRLVNPETLGETTGVMEGLKALGFVDELNDVQGMREGCDSIMRL